MGLDLPGQTSLTNTNEVLWLPRLTFTECVNVDPCGRQLLARSNEWDLQLNVTHLTRKINSLLFFFFFKSRREIKLMQLLVVANKKSITRRRRAQTPPTVGD